MEMNEKKVFKRQMYTHDSEVGRMKLQSVKENLYEATTKVVLYSIEMYTKKSIHEWVQTDLLSHIDKLNGSMKAGKDEFEQGHIGLLDITNGCAVINDFVRKESLAISRNALQAKIDIQKAKASVLEEKNALIEQRQSEIEKSIEEAALREKRKEASSEQGNGYINPDDENSFAENDIYNSSMNEDGYDNASSYNDNSISNESGYEEGLSDDGSGYEDSVTDEENEYGDEIDQYEYESVEDDIEDDDDDIEDDDDDDIDEDDAPAPLSETELFAARLSAVKDLEVLAGIREEVVEELNALNELIKELGYLTRNGKDILTHQFNEESSELENLRTLRNVEYAHKTDDVWEVSDIGEWEPEAGPLYQWASVILNYIKVIEKRYKEYSIFDEYYATKEGKDKFDGCKVYVQKQIKELYVNRSNVVFEFAGELYDKEDDEYNFRKLIENMAISWDTGIRYLTVVTNEDLPELNIFFKECLSGTNKYVDYYLIDRNALRDACNGKNPGSKDYYYFRLLYHLNPTLDKIYWRNRAYSVKEFAAQVLYKFIKVKNMYQFDARIRDYDRYLDGIDIAKWCKYHLLSDYFFVGRDDQKGQSLAREMENSILEFCSVKEDKRRSKAYNKVMKTSVYLYFYMSGEYIFSYTRSNGRTLHWRSLEEAGSYIEKADRFASYEDLYNFVDGLYKSEYFKIWRKILKMIEKSEESEGAE